MNMSDEYLDRREELLTMKYPVLMERLLELSPPQEELMRHLGEDLLSELVWLLIDRHTPDSCAGPWMRPRVEAYHHRVVDAVLKAEGLQPQKNQER